MRKENGYYILVLSFALYIFSIILFYEQIGDIAGVVGVIPIIVASRQYGRQGGVLIALLVGITGVYFLLFTDVISSSHAGMLIARSFAGILIGYIVGFSQEEAEKLRKLEQEASALKLGIEKSNEVVFITDSEGFINYINPAFTKTYGYEFAEVQGQTPRILKSGYRDQKFYKDLWGKIKSGQSLHVEMKNMTKDGRMLEIEASINPIADKNGKVMGFLAIQRDVTDKKRIEIDLVNRTRELEKLNSIMVGRELKMVEMKQKLKNQ